MERSMLLGCRDGQLATEFMATNLACNIKHYFSWLNLILVQSNSSTLDWQGILSCKSISCSKNWIGFWNRGTGEGGGKEKKNKVPIRCRGKERYKIPNSVQYIQTWSSFGLGRFGLSTIQIEDKYKEIWKAVQLQIQGNSHVCEEHSTKPRLPERLPRKVCGVRVHAKKRSARASSER